MFRLERSSQSLIYIQDYLLPISVKDCLVLFTKKETDNFVFQLVFHPSYSLILMENASFHPLLFWDDLGLAVRPA